MWLNDGHPGHTGPTSKRLLLPSYFSDSLFVTHWCSLTVVVKKIKIRFFVSYQTHVLVSSSVIPGKWNTSKTPENAPFRIQGRGRCDSGNCWGWILPSASILISSNRKFCLEIQPHTGPEEIPNGRDSITSHHLHPCYWSQAALVRPLEPIPRGSCCLSQPVIGPQHTMDTRTVSSVVHCFWVALNNESLSRRVTHILDS